MSSHLPPKIFGTTSVNDKGQVVIPVEARNALELESGSRLMVFSVPHKDALLLVKTEDVEKMVRSVTDALNQSNDQQ